MTCNPLVVEHRGEYQAWCKPCAWHSPTTTQQSLARLWAQQHKKEAR